ncbi:peroxiredoxin-like family protein [Flavobacterium ardleyense]|uniref:peroxiredoxin-like family protein n=1 Tax=Flavobacterium ardleyense TaxID=2038737 RepID=UPI00298CC63E|nr:peroxiredoxin-like family protein [Flavobacterium ardleyense]
MTNIFKTFLILFSISATVPTFAQVPTKAEDVSPLLIGEILPEASLQNADGKVLKLSTILSQKPTVMVFYRGGWCPYCNKQLSGLVDIEKEILELGYQIIAISPDDYKNLKNTEEKEKIKYSVLSDQGGKFIKEIGIAFSTPASLTDYISSKSQIGKTSDVMPVPTVLIVDKAGKILFEYINPNYKERLSGELLLAVLKTLKI